MITIFNGNQTNAIVSTLQAANTNAHPVEDTFHSFEVGEFYYTRSIVSSSTVMVWKVIKRTDKSVWLEQYYNGRASGKVKRKKINTHYSGEGELCYPNGQYSMCAVLSAERKVKSADVAEASF